jgi:hypothetical protein
MTLDAGGTDHSRRGYIGLVPPTDGDQQIGLVLPTDGDQQIGLSDRCWASGRGPTPIQ